MRTLMLAVLFSALSGAQAISPMERSIASCGIEVGIGYDRAGREAWRVAGSRTLFQPTNDQLYAIERGSVTHNHPPGVCCGLSFDDIYGLGVLRNIAEVRVVCVTGGRVRLTVARNFEALRDVDEYTLKQTVDAGVRNGGCAGLDAAWKELARRYGFDYEITP